MGSVCNHSCQLLDLGTPIKPWFVAIYPLFVETICAKNLTCRKMTNMTNMKYGLGLRPQQLPPTPPGGANMRPASPLCLLCLSPTCTRQSSLAHTQMGRDWLNDNHIHICFHCCIRICSCISECICILQFGHAHFQMGWDRLKIWKYVPTKYIPKDVPKNVPKDATKNFPKDVPKMSLKESQKKSTGWVKIQNVACMSQVAHYNIKSSCRSYVTMLQSVVARQLLSLSPFINILQLVTFAEKPLF